MLGNNENLNVIGCYKSTATPYFKTFKWVAMYTVKAMMDCLFWVSFKSQQVDVCILLKWGKWMSDSNVGNQSYGLENGHQ